MINEAKPCIDSALAWLAEWQARTGSDTDLSNKDWFSLKGVVGLIEQEARLAGARQGALMAAKLVSREWEAPVNGKPGPIEGSIRDLAAGMTLTSIAKEA